MGHRPKKREGDHRRRLGPPAGTKPRPARPPSWKLDQHGRAPRVRNEKPRLNSRRRRRARWYAEHPEHTWVADPLCQWSICWCGARESALQFVVKRRFLSREEFRKEYPSA